MPTLLVPQDVQGKLPGPVALRYINVRLPEPLYEKLRQEAFDRRTTRQAILFDIIAREFGEAAAALGE